MMSERFLIQLFQLKLKAIALVILIVFMGTCPSIAKGQIRIKLDLLPGVAGVVPAPLGIYQANEEDIRLTAKYHVRSLDRPIYYSYRLGIWAGDKGWEIEMNHLKIYLENPPDEVAFFSISHGYNQVWINHVRQTPYFDWRVGIGPVIAHNENTVRGKSWPETGGIGDMGYFVAGITSQVAVQRKQYVGSVFYLSAELKASAAFAKVKIVDGHANVPVFAAHALIGIGFDLKIY